MEVEVITERFVKCPVKGEVLLKECESCEYHDYKVGSFGMVDKIKCKKEA